MLDSLLEDVRAHLGAPKRFSQLPDGSEWSAVDDGEQIVGRRLGPIHIVGGGTQNRLLNQFAADATGRQVVTGPVEATAAGSVIVQAMALGHIGSLEEGRSIVRRSFAVTTYEPANRRPWDEAYGRLLELMEQDH